MKTISQLSLFSETPNLKRTFIALDIEATGLNAGTEKIIEIAIVKFDDDEVIDTYQTLINPHKEIPYEIIHLTGISQNEVDKAPNLEDIKEDIVKFVSDFPIVGHFIEFDLNFLKMHGIEIQNKKLDTCELARVLLPTEESYNLEILGRKFGIEHENAHRALDDTLACVELFKILQKKIQGIPKEIFEIIKSILAKGNFAWDEEFAFWEKNMKGHNNVLPFNIHTSEQKTNLNFDSITCVPIFQSSENTIFAPSRYLDLQKLNDFIKKDFFSYNETSFLIKIIIWLNTIKEDIKNKIPSRTDLKLNEKEKNIWNKIAYNSKSFLATEFFSKKSINKNLECTFEFLFEIVKNSEIELTSKQIKIIDPPDFINNLFRNLSYKISVNQLLDNCSDKNLEENIVMIFGLIGVFYKTNFGENRYETEINREILNNEYFHKVNVLLDKILENNFLNKNLKHDLMLIRNLNFYKNLYTLSITSDDNVILKIYAKNIDEEISNLKKISNNVEMHCDYSLAEKEIDYLSTILQESFVLKESFNEKINLIIETNNYSEELEKLMNFIAKKEDMDFIIITNSENNSKILYNALINFFNKDKNLILAQNQNGSIGKIQNTWITNEIKNRVLICKYDFLGLFLEKLKFQLKSKSTLIINKIPFDSLKSPINKIWSCKFKNPFIDFIIPKTTLTLKKTLATFNHSNSLEKNYLCMDDRILGYDNSLFENLKSSINFIPYN